MKFLSVIENIAYLLKNDKRYHHSDTMPKLYYLAIDKRNQMHIDDRHMLSEYMLIYFLKITLQIRNLLLITSGMKLTD